MIHGELMVQLAAFQSCSDGTGFRRRPPACAIVSASARCVSADGERDRARRLGASGRRLQPLTQRLAAPKALVLDILSAQFRRRAAAAGIAFNPAFAGAYDFSKAPDFGALMRQFLDGLPDGGLVMCHPGFVDETLISLDPLTTQREREHAFLGGAQLPPLLALNNVTLA